MPRYLLERYVPDLKPGDLPREVALIDGEMAGLRDKGMDVRRVRSVIVPEDETCFHYVEVVAEAVDALRALAALRGDRLSEAIE